MPRKIEALTFIEKPANKFLKLLLLRPKKNVEK